MLKNPNQKIIKRMAWNNLKRNARKTITLLFAVVLASFLIFTIFTVGNSYFKLQKIQNIRMSGAAPTPSRGWAPRASWIWSRPARSPACLSSVS